MLAAVVFVPLLDLLMAVVRRTRKGLSPFTPDKMHLHHRLLEIGHSHRRAVLLIYLWAGVLAFGAVALALIDDPFVVLWSVGIGLVVAVARLGRAAGPATRLTAEPGRSRVTGHRAQSDGKVTTASQVKPAKQNRAAVVASRRRPATAARSVPAWPWTDVGSETCYARRGVALERSHPVGSSIRRAALSSST